MPDWSTLADSLPFSEPPPPDAPPKTPERKRRGRPPKEETSTTFEYQGANQNVLKLLATVPEPFIEPSGPKPYVIDPADVLTPSPGFVTDFVNLGRGTEAPTIFLLWGALWTLSAAMNRNAWVQWYPKQLWPNLYVLFVAPAGLCKKSTPIDFGKSLLELSSNYRPNSVDAFENQYRFVTSKASPAGVYMMLRPEQRMFVQDHKIVVAKRSSKITLCISELATLLSKQQYMTGLVNDITDLYDCRDHGEEVTRERGIEPLEYIYITMAGAITPTGLEESVPQEMLKGGLISRMVIIYQDLPTKIYPRPLQIPGYPSLESVAKKLAWIAYNHKGEYHFTEEAEAAFSEWYTEWKTHIVAGDYALREDEHRRDTTLRKISMLLRVSEYRPGNEITLQNFLEAKAILDYTLNLSSRLLAGVGGTDFSKNLTRVKNYIEKRRTATRRQILNRFGYQIPSLELTVLLNQLLDQGIITGTLNDAPILRASGSPREIYVYQPQGGHK